MNKKLKIRYLLVISIITVIFSVLTPNFVQAKSTKLVFDASEWLDPAAPEVPPSTIMFIEDGVLHIKDFWSAHLLGGTIGDEEITGYTVSLFHAKIDLATGNMVVNGITWFYFTWGDLTGYFTGTVNAKMVSGELYGKFTLHGFEDFGGMKLFGIVWNIDEITNGLYGTLLIPH